MKRVMKKKEEALDFPHIWQVSNYIWFRSLDFGVAIVLFCL
jgi:hypothetical protein